MHENKTLETISDRELAFKFKQWKDIEKKGKKIMAEVIARFKENGSVDGIKKVVHQTRLSWDKDKKYPEEFYEKVLMSVKDCLNNEKFTREVEKEVMVKGKVKKVKVREFIPGLKECVTSKETHTYKVNL